MSVQEENDQRKNIVSPEFSGAANPKQSEEEKKMSQEYDGYAIGDPFENHRIHTEYNVSNADIDRILRPILEEHGVNLSDYNADNLSYKIGDKTIRFSVGEYDGDPEFSSSMKFMGKAVNIRKTLFVSNRCSIKGTEILVDFLKVFQKQYPETFFETVKGAYRDKDELQKFHIDGELMYDPDVASFLEVEDKEAYLQGLDNVHK